MISRDFQGFLRICKISGIILGFLGISSGPSVWPFFDHLKEYSKMTWGIYPSWVNDIIYFDTLEWLSDIGVEICVCCTYHINGCIHDFDGQTCDIVGQINFFFLLRMSL